MIRTIDGRRYLMRDTRPVKELRKMYVSFVTKYGNSLSFHQWLNRGRIYLEIKQKDVL